MINLLNSLDLTGKITFFIQDWGVVIGLHYALRFPDKVARIMVGSCISLNGSCPTPEELEQRAAAGLVVDEHGRLPLAFCRVGSPHLSPWASYRAL